MVIGGGPFQLPLIKKGIKRGFWVYCTSSIKDDPGLSVADEALNISILDVDSLKEFCSSEKINCIVTAASDLGSITVGYLNNKLNLKGINEKQVLSVSNKGQFADLQNADLRNADLDRITKLAIPYLKEAGYPTDDFELLRQIVASARERIDYISQIVEHTKIFFADIVEFETDEARELASQEKSKEIYQIFLDELELLEELNGESFRKIIKKIQKKAKVRGKGLWMPIRVGLTGQMHGPDISLIVKILGKEGCRARILSVL